MATDTRKDAAAVRVIPPVVPVLTILAGVGLARLWPILPDLALPSPLRYWLGGTIIAISIPLIPNIARVVRSNTLSLRELPFVEAGRAAGMSELRIAIRHVLPNTMAPLIVLATAQLGAAILTEASLSFLGLGIPEPHPSWGRMLSESAAEYVRVAPWLVIFPGIAISLAVFGTNLLGDAVRDLLDPRQRDDASQRAYVGRILPNTLRWAGQTSFHSEASDNATDAAFADGGVSDAELIELLLDYCGADTQGAIGYMLQQNLVNDFRQRGITKNVATIVTQVEVNPDDPAFGAPSKPIGSFMDEAKAMQRRDEDGWDVTEDAGRGWRRVVASPKPKRIVEIEVIKQLAASGVQILSTGGSAKALIGAGVEVTEGAGAYRDMRGSGTAFIECEELSTDPEAPPCFEDARAVVNGTLEF